jgi:hypothetical protein
MGVILGSAVVPIALACTWSKANKWGCIVGSLVGFVAGVVAWLITTSALNGRKINVVVRPIVFCLVRMGKVTLFIRPVVVITRCLLAISRLSGSAGSSLRRHLTS